MSPGSNTESYPAFARIGLRENPGKNLNQVTCTYRDSNPGHLVSQPDALTVTPQLRDAENGRLAVLVLILLRQKQFLLRWNSGRPLHYVIDVYERRTEVHEVPAPERIFLRSITLSSYDDAEYLHGNKLSYVLRYIKITLEIESKSVVQTQRRFRREFNVQRHDEAHSHLNDFVNKQNFRYWSHTNPMALHERPLHCEKNSYFLEVDFPSQRLNIEIGHQALLYEKELKTLTDVIENERNMNASQKGNLISKKK
ncbi:hypothetical protein ANN_06156 [Periplaneta americana]|uniref:DUF4817 domain-containing protein n=1 Tax=Periplaneta americana TaxID=6978 RepID=A0ABQ8TEJ2_PERAM|nr:hypothetical protein ANN_06156 [Periplaneta americana]